MKAARHETLKRIDQGNTGLERPMAYFFTVLRTELVQRCSRMGIGTATNEADARDDRVVDVDESDRGDVDQRTAGPAVVYDKAEVRERLWRRVTPEERAAMWQMGSTEDRAAYTELVAQGLDWPGAADATQLRPIGNSHGRGLHFGRGLLR